MLKFYYSGAPNPTKVALFLEETGIPYRGDSGTTPARASSAEAGMPAPSIRTPKVPAIVDGDTTVFDSNAILLYLAGEYRQVLRRRATRRAARCCHG